MLSWLFRKPKDDCYPFHLGRKRLMFSERTEQAKPILLGTRTFETGSGIHLFARSDLVKRGLEREIIEDRSCNARVHPSAIELRAAILTITFLECVAADDTIRDDRPKVIEHDNWGRIFWAFVELFESGDGFLSRWEDRYSYTRDLWHNEPRYSVDQLSVASLTGKCGRSYSLPNGQILLEYVDSI